MSEIQVTLPPHRDRTECHKCGGTLPGSGDHTGSAGWCSTCRWLLGGGAPAPSDEVLARLGRERRWEDRQRKEPIPFIPLSVEDWPEVHKKIGVPKPPGPSGALYELLMTVN